VVAGLLTLEAELELGGTQGLVAIHKFLISNA